MTAASQMPDILSPEFAQDPQPYYKIMRDHYPLLHHEASGYFISRLRTSRVPTGTPRRSATSTTDSRWSP